MWHFVLAAVVAASTGFVTKHFLTHRNTVEVDNSNLHDPTAFVFSSSESTSQTRNRDDVFTNGVMAPVRSELRNGGRRLRFCFNKRKTAKDAAANALFGSFKDDSLFGWGLCFGIMCMMSDGKAEINKLNKTMDETAKLVQELKSEIDRRKSSHSLENLDAVGDDAMNVCKIRGRDEVMLKNTDSELTDTNVKIWSPGVNDGGECGSSVLTEEPEPQVLEMDQLEAELEFELQKLSGCTTDGPCHEEIKPNLDEFEAPDEGNHGTDGWNLNYSESHGVSASELHQKLSHLLIKQQENQIMELQSELHQAQSNLHEKEAELQALKDWVKRLSELPLSTMMKH
ncbi:hypothetical protein CR513_08796, partial [Mucuna pruriens]